MIEVESLTRVYGSLTAVDNVSFSIGKGEVVGLLGHNGAGKSTIMKMLTGYLEPTSGSIRVDSLRMGHDTRAIQARIGYLPENCPVWPEMTPIDYLDYQASLHGVAAADRDAKIARAIRRAQLAEKARDRIETLSRGYRQRVGVAQAILHDPDIIILDEPTNGLDPTQVREMRGLIRELAQSATVILSTHILQEVRAVCERVLIMRRGQLVLDERIDALEAASGLRLATDHDLSDRLSQLDGVKQVQALDSVDGRFAFALDAGHETAPEIARAVLDAGAALYALEPHRRDLETVFAELNEGEAAHAA
ncbi:ABC transporter ATP-binding protein [Paracoccus binzhouensis]|uniref:ABC transporter ATP-binding protein n=1 Tax=Paracoccus binzhouensis TaxID=2796149 RepID=UPI0018EEF1FA|nr:ABC transporter ATP-binding protein [Paracoccus binzhouensis]